nr:DNA-binding transcriptional regulator [Sedimentisphaera cyanobacteriorum]
MARALDRELARGISKYARFQSRTRWAFYSEPDIQRRLKIIPKLKDWKANGIIAHNPTPKNKQLIMKLGIPVITRGIKIAGYPHISSDLEKISQMAANHLLERGYKNFAYCGFDSAEWSVMRGEYFAKMIKKASANITIYSQPKRGSWLSWEKEQPIMAEWLESLPKPIAVLACNDDRARQVIEAGKFADIHVPEEVAVLGIDNDEHVCELSDPPLSSIALNSERAGFEAAKLLDKMMVDKTECEDEIIVKPTHIVTRQSTNILAIEDSEVASAINYIRNNSRKLIQVDDVAEATSISRRVLENRFRKILNRSILEEINLTHINQILQMLLETNFSISEISEVMGYSSDKHIARSFRKHMGMSPLAYRKKFGSR